MKFVVSGRQPSDCSEFGTKIRPCALFGCYAAQFGTIDSTVVRSVSSEIRNLSHRYTGTAHSSLAYSLALVLSLALKLFSLDSRWGLSL